MAGRDKIQTPGRKDNAAQPLNADKTTETPEGGPERYPAVRTDDGIEQANEHRSFDPERGSKGRSPATSPPDGPPGPGSGPVEGKR